MIRASDLINVIPRVPAGPASRSADASSAASWFDSAAAVAGTRISADLSPASRGLSVEQHAAQVLSHLCGEREPGA